jgi:cardiolipin synthase
VIEDQVSNRIVTVPNLISFARLAAVPVFWWLLLGRDRVGAATVLLIVVSWSDWVDGYLARRFDQVTKLGKALDPIADRLMIASAVVAGLTTEIVPWVVGVPLLVRELYMAAITLVLAVRKRPSLEVRYLGKLATFVVYGSIHSFYIAAVPFLADLVRPIAWVTSVTGLLLYWIVAFQYTGDARSALTELESGAILEEG